MPQGEDAGLHVHLREDEKGVRFEVGRVLFRAAPRTPRVTNRGIVPTRSCVGAEGRSQAPSYGRHRLAGQTSSRRTITLVASEISPQSSVTPIVLVIDRLLVKIRRMVPSGSEGHGSLLDPMRT
jgi:hypothetical protein